jgi:hypothetical protein
VVAVGAAAGGGSRRRATHGGMAAPLHLALMAISERTFVALVLASSHAGVLARDHRHTDLVDVRADCCRQT